MKRTLIMLYKGVKALSWKPNEHKIITIDHILKIGGWRIGNEEVIVFGHGSIQHAINLRLTILNICYDLGVNSAYIKKHITKPGKPEYLLIQPCKI